MSSRPQVAELLSKMKSYSERVKPLLEHCDTEEQTKISFINPFIEVLDHDVRDPRQVRFEYTVDVRLNKEKVDYAIFHDGDPTILVEAKAVGADLTNGRHLEQIRSYANQMYSVKFVALTNGVDWHWFKKENRQFDGYGLEEKPFLSHNVLKPGSQELSFLLTICGRGMDVTSAEEQALETRLLTAFEEWLHNQLKEESLDDDLVALLTRKYVGMALPKNLEKTRRLWTISINRFVEKRIEERLHMAQNTDTSQTNVNMNNVTSVDVEESIGDEDQAIPASTNVTTREYMTESGVVVISSNQRRRAWRTKDDENWRIEKQGNELFVNVLKFIASRHDFGPRAFYEAISQTRNKVISNDTMVYDRYRNATAIGHGYFVEVNSSNVVKDGWLKDVAKEVLVQGEHRDVTDMVEWWL